MDDMKEVIALEQEIRQHIIAAHKALVNAMPGDARRFDMTYVFEGESLLSGKATFTPGTRLERLRTIAGGLRGQKF